MAANSETLYGNDFAEWSAQTAELPRLRKFDEIDIENAAEEIQGLGDGQFQSARSQLRRMPMHKRARLETGLGAEEIPVECPLTLNQLPEGDPTLLRF